MLTLDHRSETGNQNMTESEFKADVSCLGDVTAFVESELEKTDCPPRTATQICVAVEEIFVNIAHYAYTDGSGMMRLAVWTDRDSIILRFRDCGMPFDPLSIEEPDITLSASERKIGGLGIFMVRKSMDDISYVYENGQNVLTLTKKIR